MVEPRTIRLCRCDWLADPVQGRKSLRIPQKNRARGIAPCRADDGHVRRQFPWQRDFGSTFEDTLQFFQRRLLAFGHQPQSVFVESQASFGASRRFRSVRRRALRTGDQLYESGPGDDDCFDHRHSPTVETDSAALFARYLPLRRSFRRPAVSPLR